MSLSGKIVCVSGASRGIGKGIAIELARAGATVYATGRAPQQRDNLKTAGTLEDLDAEVRSAGGSGRIIAVHCDHANDADVKALFERIAKEQSGRCDVLINNAVANVTYLAKNMGTKFFELDDDPGYTWDLYNNAGLRGYYICSYYAAKLMIPRKSGLIVTIGSAGGVKHLFTTLYGVQKEANDRMIADIAIELKDTGVRAISLHPGPVDTEALKESLGNSKAAALFSGAESIYFAGRCLAHLIPDTKFLEERNGQIVLSTELSERYSELKDVNGESVKHDSHVKLQPIYDNLNKLRTHDLR